MFFMERKHSKLALAVGLALGAGSCLGGSWVEAAPAAGAMNELAKPDAAQQELWAQERRIAQKSQPVKDIKVDYQKVPVTQLIVNGYPGMGETELKKLVPEATQATVNVEQLAKQIQVANASGAMHLSANFRHARGGDGYVLTLNAEQRKQTHTIVAVHNGGNDYSGNWRTVVSFIDGNTSKHADTLGVAYMTSPAGGHWSDVKQAALSYRLPLAKMGDFLTFNFSYSNVDLSNLYQAGDFNLGATGKGVAEGLHYQRNLTYTSRSKAAWDFGINHWDMRNGLTVNGATLGDETKYTLTTGNVFYLRQILKARNALNAKVGFQTNLGTPGSQYRQVVSDSDSHFVTLQAEADYQYRTPADWLVRARAVAQYTDKVLLPCVQLGAGGRTTVRGFTERAIAADKGILGNLEFYTPEVGPGSRFLFFLDGAALSSNSDYVSDKHQNISSWGVGYRYANRDNLHVAVDYADIIQDLSKGSDQQHKRWNATVSAEF